MQHLRIGHDPAKSAVTFREMRNHGELGNNSDALEGVDGLLLLGDRGLQFDNLAGGRASRLPVTTASKVRIG